MKQEYTKAMSAFKAALEILLQTKTKGKRDVPFYIALILLHMADLSRRLRNKEDEERYRSTAAKFLIEKGLVVQEM